MENTESKKTEGTEGIEGEMWDIFEKDFSKLTYVMFSKYFQIYLKYSKETTQFEIAPCTGKPNYNIIKILEESKVSLRSFLFYDTRTPEKITFRDKMTNEIILEVNISGHCYVRNHGFCATVFFKFMLSKDNEAIMELERI